MYCKWTHKYWVKPTIPVEVLLAASSCVHRARVTTWNHRSINTLAEMVCVLLGWIIVSALHQDGADEKTGAAINNKMKTVQDIFLCLLITLQWGYIAVITPLILKSHDQSFLHSAVGQTPKILNPVIILVLDRPIKWSYSPGDLDRETDYSSKHNFSSFVKLLCLNPVTVFSGSE